VHRLSPALTLQGAVAHVDMPLESGPTLYLPHSQKYAAGYLAVGDPAFQAWFDAHRVQLPLAKGDAVFFNPALMHAAGANRSAGIRRLGNLLQVSSAFGRAMETVDRTAMSRVLYPVVQARMASGAMSREQALRAIAACADGYSFPSNLDRDPPGATLMPESQQALMLRALAEGWPAARFSEEVTAQARRRRTDGED
jgi:ectoine hydroxylase-related dioxygenase (phytanoyl-CoA dioxygenase family)